MKKYKNLELKKLLDAKKMTSWAYYVCQGLNINEIDAMLAYYEKHGNFLASPTCGAKINDQLVRLCKKLNSSPEVFYQVLNMIVVPENMFKNPFLVKKLDFYIMESIENLSTRAKNTLKKYTNNTSVGLKEIYDVFDLKNEVIRFPFLPGVKTENELAEFVKDIIKTYVKFSKEKINETEIRILNIKHITGVSNIKNPDLLNGIKNKKFLFVQFLWENYIDVFGMNAVDNDIFRNYLYLNKKKLGLSEIGEKHNLTNERIRQRRISLLENLDMKANIVKELAEYSNILDIFPNDNVVRVDDKLLKKIAPNGSYDKIPKSFICFVLYLLYVEKYFYVNPGTKLKRPHRIFNNEYLEQHKNFKNSYLISKNLFKKEELVRLTNLAVENQVCRLVTQNEVKFEDFDPLLSNTNRANAFKTILETDFDIEVTNKTIIFSKNRNILSTSMIYDALKKIGKPAHLSQIITEIKKVNKTINISESSLRYYLVYFKDMFIFFGRTSTYGLKEWEAKFKNIKGGTIRDMVIEYLRENPNANHIDQIAKYVSRYRDTDSEKIYANLKLDTKHRFDFHKGNFITLVPGNIYA